MFTSRPIFFCSMGVAPLVAAQESEKEDVAMTTLETQPSPECLSQVGHLYEHEPVRRG